MVKFQVHGFKVSHESEIAVACNSKITGRKLLGFIGITIMLEDICKYFGIMPMDDQISARQSKFYLRYCA